MILPQYPNWNIDKFIEKNNASKVQKGFTYNSGTNDNFLSVNQLEILLRDNFE